MIFYAIYTRANFVSAKYNVKNAFSSEASGDKQKIIKLHQFISLLHLSTPAKMIVMTIQFHSIINTQKNEQNVSSRNKTCTSHNFHKLSTNPISNLCVFVFFFCKRPTI